jgi:diaminopimelate decarboxylase
MEGISRSIGRLNDDLSLIPDCRLNLALKSCHTLPVLRRLALLGLGADVASVGELRLAQEAGFSELSATGPSFSSRSSLDVLRSSGVVLDVDSADQLRFVADRSEHVDIGLRVRIPLPQRYDKENVFGSNSRFGVDVLDPEIHDLLSGRFRVTRLHVHTGQLTPEMLLFELRYLLTVASAMPSVELIDLGGGLFDFYVSRERARSALAQAGRLVSEWQEKTGRAMRTRFEPGGAVLAPHGFLLTTVQAVERDHAVFKRSIVQVDASAWNLAPWHKPEVRFADVSRIDAERERAVLAGNTLYEGDYFGLNAVGSLHSYTVPTCVPGDRLVVTNAGAYTMTNRRNFNCLGAIDEYIFDGETVEPCSSHSHVAPDA